jgi:hypothetical protein
VAGAAMPRSRSFSRREEEARRERGWDEKKNWKGEDEVVVYI